MSDKKVKRILIFSLAYYPHVGGAEVAIKEVTDRTSPDEIDFHMVTMRFSTTDASEEKIGNIFVHRIGGGNSRWHKFLFQFNAARFASVLHRTQSFDAVWAMMAHSAGVPAALFSLHYPSVPYILSLQEGDPISHIERTMLPLWPLFTRAFKNASIILPLSTYLARWARARGYTGPVEIVPNGVSVREFVGAPIAHKGTILITTSRLVHKNAIDDVIRALSLLPESVHFHILGSGPEEHTLKMLVHECGVGNRVVFLGHIDRARMPSYLHAADIFIRPSRTEGFGISFVEAMAAGLPVIATQEGGIADFLYDEKRNPDTETTGWAVDADSPEQIAEAVKDILVHPEQVARVVATAKRMVNERYDWDLIAKQMRDIFARIGV
ncbi:glycosyltransferase family 1 protein [Candidatus Kaiserbacteria bacterium]|nr:glycosyltransferase family 1 protein [Candidatus Kaiserbacteria bacterium]